MEKLKRIVQENPCYVLFPSDTSTDVSTFVDAMKDYKNELQDIEIDNIQSKESKEGDSNIINNNKLTLIVLDGTWREARRLRHCDILEDLPKIQLSLDTMTDYKSRFIARQKSNVKERISTLEAVALFLREMALIKNKNEPTDDIIRNEETIAEVLLNNLDIVMQQLLLQSGMKSKSNLKRMKQ